MAAEEQPAQVTSPVWRRPHPASSFLNPIHIMATIDSVSTSGSSYSASLYQSNSQVKADFKSLSDALKSGDLSSAQTAFASLQKDAPALFSSSKNTNQSNPLNAIGTALKNGDVAAAKTALASLQKGHHGHRSRQSGSAASTSSETSTPSASTSSTDTTGTLFNAQG